MNEFNGRREWMAGGQLPERNQRIHRCIVGICRWRRRLHSWHRHSEKSHLDVVMNRFGNSSLAPLRIVGTDFPCIVERIGHTWNLADSWTGMACIARCMTRTLLRIGHSPGLGWHNSGTVPHSGIVAVAERIVGIRSHRRAVDRLRLLLIDAVW